MSSFYSLFPSWVSGVDPRAQLALALVTAHLIGDFILQTDAMVQRKRDPAILANHSIIHGILAYVIAGYWSLVWMPAVVAVTHGLIDAVKARSPKSNQMIFWIDQAVHLTVIGFLASHPGRSLEDSAWVSLVGGVFARSLAVVCGAIVCTRVASIAIGFWVQPYLEEIKRAGPRLENPRGLTNGGRAIGQWERALIFVFVLIGQPAALGFLIAAKSIFRFGELMDRQNRMEAEYITIGTLMSFGIGIVISVATLALCRRL